MRPGLIVFSTPMTHRPIPVTFHHRVAFTHGAFDPKNLTLRDLVAEACDLDGSAKVLVLLDSGVAAADPKLAGRISQYFAVHTDTLNLVTDPILLTGGEACKNDWSLVEKIWKAIEYFKICRHSYVIAIGGGAFLDLAGFGAATAHRGIRLIRMPTTTLSQGDGGVGVKNGVNYFGKKNWIGTFSVPFAVVNDLDFLSVLPPRACRDGIIEAIKVALIRDRAFYDFLLANGSALGRLEKKPLELAIRRSAENHVDHIATSGDPFEYGSARPLDFGHWVAHKLEQISNFAVSHGEAVAVGMAVDLLYSPARPPKRSSISSKPWDSKSGRPNSTAKNADAPSFSPAWRNSASTSADDSPSPSSPASAKSSKSTRWTKTPSSQRSRSCGRGVAGWRR